MASLSHAPGGKCLSQRTGRFDSFTAWRLECWIRNYQAYGSCWKSVAVFLTLLIQFS